MEDSQKSLIFLATFALIIGTVSCINGKTSQGFLVHSEDTSSSSSSSSENAVESKGENIVQIFTISRHGTATQVGKPFVPDEYTAYKIEDKDFRDHELLTALGGGQCWSIGKNLNSKYPAIFNEEIFDKTKANFHLYYEQKSIKCSHFLEDGMRGITTDIGVYSYPLVREAFEEHGNCPDCFSDSAFPFDESQLIAEFSDSDVLGFSDSSIHMIDQLFSDHQIDFLDWNGECENIEDLYEYKSCKGLSIQDRKRLFIDPSSEDYTGTHTLYGASKHFYHKLPNFGLSKKAYNLLANEDWDFAEGDFTLFYDGPLVASYVHALAISKRLLKQLETGKLWNGYLVHNNNIAALLVLLLGKNQDKSYYYPYYATTVELLVKSDEEGDLYVILSKDNTHLKMKECQMKCPIAKFKEILQSIVDHEDDAVKFCEDDDD